MTQDTPWRSGPWRVEADMRSDYDRNIRLETESLAGWNVLSNDGAIVDIEGIIPGKTAEAEACLIAAAPSLYEALVKLMHELEWVNEQLDLMPDDYAESLNVARAALAAARGEQ